MKIGCVVNDINEAQTIMGFGYDYVEIKGEMLLVDEARFSQIADIVHSNSIIIDAITSPLPRSLDLKLTGPNAEIEKCLYVFEKVCARGASLGVKIIVLGAGKARFVEAGFPRQLAYEQLDSFLRPVADICRIHNVILAVETLNTNETNILNTTFETRQLIDKVNRPEINMVLDYYHVFSQELSLQQEYKSVCDKLVHVHTSDPGRCYPGSAPSVQAPFLEFLKSIRYNDRISVECSFGLIEQEAPLALGFLRSLLSDN